MSSILKALEKVEEAQSGRRSGAAGFVKARQRRSPWVLPVAVLSGAVVAALATFAAMGGFSRYPAPAPQAALVAQQEPVAAPVSAPQLAVPAAPAVAPQLQGAAKQAVQLQTTQKPAASVAAPGKAAAAPTKAAAAPAKGPGAASAKAVAVPAKSGAASAKAVGSGSAKSASAKPTAKAAKKDRKSDEKSAKRERKERLARQRERERERSARRSHRDRESRSQAVAEPAKAVAPQAAAPAAVAAHAPEKPHHAIRVTGIAWQNDSASSVVMINGRSVQQGATVDGYKVEQIYEDKVRLSGAGGKIEVPLGAGE